jgi:TRAP-type C4-dicarboxylate transport system permease small subunit
VPADALTGLTRRVNRVFVALAGAIAAAILGVIGYDLVLRNVFDAPTPWALDVARFLLVYLFFFALAPALESGAHVSVDIVEHNMPPRVRRWFRIVALGFVIVFGGFLLWQVTRTAIEAYHDDALFPTFIPVKLIEVYWIGPVGIVQFLLTALALLAATWRAKPAR